MPSRRRLNAFWPPQPKQLALFNAAALALAVLANAYFQVFCRPTPWATVVLALCFVSAVATPLLHARRRWAPITQFVNGLGLLVFAYCAVFLEWLSVVGIGLIFLFGVGLLAYVPLFFVIQLLYHGLWRPARAGTRRYFVAGVTVGLLVLFAAAWTYERALDDIRAFEASGYTDLRRTFMTEKVLGLGIRYHAELSFYDGWRPPLHEPLVNIGYWLHGKTDPLSVDLMYRVRLHKEFFPDVPRRLDCSCAWQYHEWYERDVRWW